MQVFECIYVCGENCAGMQKKRKYQQGRTEKKNSKNKIKIVSDVFFKLKASGYVSFLLIYIYIEC